MHSACCRVPKRFAIAFDGSPTSRKMVEAVARSPLLKELRCEVVMAGDETAIGREHLEWAKTSLSVAGFDVQVAVVAGEPETVLPHYLKAHSVDLLVIGCIFQPIVDSVSG